MSAENITPGRWEIGVRGLNLARHQLPLRFLDLWGVFLFVLTMVCPARAAEPVNSPMAASEWLVRTWQTRDGLPQNSVNAIAQTRDGYLWVGTSGGLARFDGARFRSFGLQEGLRSVRISSLLEDRKGALWVGTTGGGLSRWADGRFAAVAALEGFEGADIVAMAAEPGGTLWIGTDRGLLRWRDGAFSQIGPADGLPAKQIRALCRDSQGTLWVSVVPGGLFQGTGGRFIPGPRNPSAPSPVYSLLADRQGNLWAGSDTGVLWQWQGELWKRYGPTNGLPKSNIEALAQGTDNRIWAGTRSAGLYFFSEGSFHGLAEPTGPALRTEAARRLFVDPDGAVWVGTSSSGLSRLSGRLLYHWGAAEGLIHPHVAALAEDISGGLWVGTHEGGIYRFLNRRFGKLADPAVSGVYPYMYSAATTSGWKRLDGRRKLPFPFQKGSADSGLFGPPNQR